MTLLRLAPSLFLWMLLPCGCDPPVYLVSADASTSARDAQVDGGFDLATCKSCIADPDKPGPGCGTSYSDCTANSECAAMIACAFQSGCLGGPSSAFISCALPCAEEAGALTGASPAITLATPLFQCIANGACQPVCLTE